MPILVRMDWDGVSVEQYDQLRAVVNWEGDQPAGGLAHVAAFDNGGAHINDIWESAERFEEFNTKRLGPGVEQVGIVGAPRVTLMDAHAVYIPGVTH